MRFARDIAGRTRHWREYCCESFCDTAAWLYSGSNGTMSSLWPQAGAASGELVPESIENRTLSI